VETSSWVCTKYCRFVDLDLMSSRFCLGFRFFFLLSATDLTRYQGSLLARG
jgi:hypothetical protein